MKRLFNIAQQMHVLFKILFLGFFQYIHGLATQLAYYMHEPDERLSDIGFHFIPALGKENGWVSEYVFATSFFTFILFLIKRQSIYIIYNWLLLVSLSQFLRIITFLSTSLPSPNYHCQWPTNHFENYQWYNFFILDIKRQSTKSCGDLIFSSHMIFTLSFYLITKNYGIHRLLRTYFYLNIYIMGYLIVASRKHYTVDVIVACYVVPLVHLTLKNRNYYKDQPTRLPL